jgi:hypothetical protein
MMHVLTHPKASRIHEILKYMNYNTSCEHIVAIYFLLHVNYIIR